jgi:hypothetical protein
MQYLISGVSNTREGCKHFLDSFTGKKKSMHVIKEKIIEEFLEKRKRQGKLPASASRRVVLPQPEGPMIAKTSPGRA